MALGGKYVTNLELCSNIRFLTKWSRCAADTYGMLTHVYGDATLPCAWIWLTKKTLMGNEIDMIQSPSNPQLWKVMKTLKEFEIWWAVITSWWLEPWIMWDLDQRCGHVKVCACGDSGQNIGTQPRNEKELEVFAHIAEETGKLPEYLNSVISGDISCYSTMILEFKKKKKKPPVDSKLFSVMKEVRQGCHTCMWRVCRMCFLTLKVLCTMNIFQWGVWLTSTLVRCCGACKRICALWEIGSLGSQQITITEHPPNMLDCDSCDVFIFESKMFYSGNSFWPCTACKDMI